MENKGGKRLAPTGEPVKTTPPATAADEVKTPAEQPAPAESAAPAPAETAAPAAKPAKSRGRRLWDDYGYLLVTLAAVFVLFKVLLQLAYVPSGSMETTIPTKCAAGRLAAALCGVRPGAGARRHRHLLGRGAEQASW